MTNGHGGDNVIVHICPISGCGGKIELVGVEKFVYADCLDCGCSMWPLEMGYTGNDPIKVKEFARTHNLDRTPK